MAFDRQPDESGTFSLDPDSALQQKQSTVYVTLLVNFEGRED
jgi:hypothetical protein